MGYTRGQVQWPTKVALPDSFCSGEFGGNGTIELKQLHFRKHNLNSQEKITNINNKITKLITSPQDFPKP